MIFSRREPAPDKQILCATRQPESSTAPSGWVFQTNTYTVPSGVAFVLFYANVNSPTVATVLRVDDGFIYDDRISLQIVDNMDYLPFGEQISGGSTTTHKFTGDERDSETNLDHTLFRQYASSQGRWTTPDPAGLAAVDPTNPQSWNRYAYVLNSPLSNVDPTGLACYPLEVELGLCDGGGGGIVPCGIFGTIFCGPPGSGLPCAEGIPGCDPVPILLPPIGIGGGGGGSSGQSGPTPIPAPPVDVGDPLGGTGPIWSEQFPVGTGPTNPFLTIQNAIGVDDAVEITLCVVEPWLCVAVAATVVVGIVAVEVIKTVHMSQHGGGEMSDTGIMNEVYQLIRAGKAAGVCLALDILEAAARAAGDTKKLGRIITTQKAQGCKASRQSSNR